MAKFVTAVVVTSPWILHVVFTIPQLVLHVIVAHARPEPHTSRDIERQDSFWSTLAAELADCQRPLSATLLLIDANAHVGSVVSDAVENLQQQEKNKNICALRTICEENEINIVNSFYAAGDTWTGSKGAPDPESTTSLSRVSSWQLCQIAVCWVISTWPRLNATTTF